MYRRSCGIIVSVLLFSIGVLSADEGFATVTDESTSFSSRIIAVTDVVLELHIDPPARQQMILAGVKALYLADDRQVPKNLSRRVSELATLAEFADYLDVVREEFIERKNAEEILTLGMLSAVPGDSFILEAKANEVNTQVINNRYVGTGIALTTSRKEKLAQITRVFYQGPAWKAGVKSLDLILEIDGESTFSKDLSQVVEALRGESGSDVEVVVRQPDSEETRRLTMTRGRVFIPSIEGVSEESDGQWQYSVGADKDIALLRFKSIGPSTLHELRLLAGKMHRDNVRGVVIDLREGGGILHDIIMVADSLIDRGTIGHVRSLERTIKHEARPGDLFEGLPVAVLVSKHSSAGNVFLSAALQDNERAVVVGEPTGGETYVSSFVAIADRKDRLKLATAVMQRGDGTPILPNGFPRLPITAPSDTHQMKRPGFIMPDHVVYPAPPRANSDRQQDIDPMLVKAIEVLKTSPTRASSSQKDNIDAE